VIRQYWRNTEVTVTTLERLIEEKRTNIPQLAKASGVPERTVYRHARGESTMKAPHVAAYARALRVSAAKLIEDAA
jgi:predicted transcriptional regulator